MATRHLAELGHRRIGFVGARNDEWWAHQTRAGYVDALGQLGLAHDPNLEVLVANDIEPAHRAASVLFGLADRPSAIFAGSGKIAIGVMKSAREYGPAIPQDLAVVGTGDHDFAMMIDPPLTTVSVHGVRIGRRAAELLLSRIHGTSVPESTIIRPDLIVRATSGPLANQREGPSHGILNADPIPGTLHFEVHRAASVRSHGGARHHDV